MLAGSGEPSATSDAVCAWPAERGRISCLTFLKLSQTSLSFSWLETFEPLPLPALQNLARRQQQEPPVSLKRRIFPELAARKRQEHLGGLPRLSRTGRSSVHRKGLETAADYIWDPIETPC